MLLLLLLALRQGRRPAPGWMALLLVIEVIALNSVMAANGAASNPFSAVLLVPVVLAFMLLPWWVAVSILAISVSAQLIQLLLLQLSQHGQMLHHYYGMVFGFVLTSLVIAAVITYFRQQIQQRENAIRTLRERQLRNEQLLAIGTAAAQLTHDVATPVQSIHLLLEEALEQPQTSPQLAEISEQFKRIEQQLAQWRTVADDVREQRTVVMDVRKMWRSLQHLLLVARPEALIHWHWLSGEQTALVKADGTLLPALTNMIINACEAAEQTNQPKVTIRSQLHQGEWQLQITNMAQPLSPQALKNLGLSFVESGNGHGIGAALSNATIEKFGGTVHWQQHALEVLTVISIPVVANV
ncbi:HAMP domain-containing histidine kinase [Shewanella avicenniae]|uniref:histidine kinase n=1 Tax=Shewanella avicenniae TaxID=2814294 RepID=A0ABX7QND5_9GAMM|nr:ATP-binding protein [Shewanella avicenniae]QSX32270.1 HAMP domain-containing histidine kinase [Shewanella avicenniae]